MLFCGFFAIVVASRVAAPTVETARSPSTSAIELKFPLDLIEGDATHNLVLCGWLIFLALVFDALDGHVARLARTSSDFGAHLDSLCDLVTFGVAPAILLVKMCPVFSFDHRAAIWVIAAAFAACTALRLARFNVESGDDEDHLYFSGLPSPAAAACIAGFAILSYALRKDERLEIDEVVQGILPLFVLLLGLLMVSRIPYPHMVNQVLRGQRSFGHIVKLLFAFVLVMMIRGYAVPIVCCAFVLGPPLRYAWAVAAHRDVKREPLF